MDPQHIITGASAAFAKSVNQLIVARDVALSIRSISLTGETLAAVVEESQRHPGSPGALIRISATRQKNPAKHLAELRQENPLWTVEAVFATEDDKGKSSTLVVASLRQP